MKRTSLVVVLLATAALADVPADADALEYVGAFEGAAPGSVVTVALWDARTGGTAACPPVSAVVTGTRFVASLNAQCVARIRGAAPLFVEVT